MASAVSDEQIIAALMSTGTYKDTAKTVGMSERNLYERMGNRDFKEQYKRAKTDVVRKAIFKLNKSISLAVDTVVKIMSDENTNPATRLQAAQTILNNANKFAERLNTDEVTVAEQQRAKLVRYL